MLLNARFKGNDYEGNISVATFSSLSLISCLIKCTLINMVVIQQYIFGLVSREERERTFVHALRNTLGVTGALPV